MHHSPSVFMGGIIFKRKYISLPLPQLRPFQGGQLIKMLEPNLGAFWLYSKRSSWVNRWLQWMLHFNHQYHTLSVLEHIFFPRHNLRNISVFKCIFPFSSYKQKHCNRWWCFTYRPFCLQNNNKIYIRPQWIITPVTTLIIFILYILIFSSIT